MDDSITSWLGGSGMLSSDMGTGNMTGYDTPWLGDVMGGYYASIPQMDWGYSYQQPDYSMMYEPSYDPSFYATPEEQQFDPMDYNAGGVAQEPNYAALLGGVTGGIGALQGFNLQQAYPQGGTLQTQPGTTSANPAAEAVASGASGGQQAAANAGYNPLTANAYLGAMPILGTRKSSNPFDLGDILRGADLNAVPAAEAEAARIAGNQPVNAVDILNGVKGGGAVKVNQPQKQPVRRNNIPNLPNNVPNWGGPQMRQPPFQGMPRMPQPGPIRMPNLNRGGPPQQQLRKKPAKQAPIAELMAEYKKAAAESKKRNEDRKAEIDAAYKKQEERTRAAYGGGTSMAQSTDRTTTRDGYSNQTRFANSNPSNPGGGQITNVRSEEINRQYDQLAAKVQQQAVSRGIGGTTVLANLLRGVEDDRQRALRQSASEFLQQQLAATNAINTQAQQFKERINEPGPDLNQYLQLAMMLGRSDSNAYDYGEA